MIDTEHVKCDTCTAPEPMEFDASDEPRAAGLPSTSRPIPTRHSSRFSSSTPRSPSSIVPPPRSAPPACSTPSVTSISA